MKRVEGTWHGLEVGPVFDGDRIGWVDGDGPQARRLPPREHGALVARSGGLTTGLVCRATMEVVDVPDAAPEDTLAPRDRCQSPGP